MAKRYTDNQKWSKPFIRALEAPYKLLWFFILDECDHAGIWQIDMDVARIKTGCQNLNLEEAKKVFGDKVIVFDGDEKMFVQDFIDFQYGTLKPENRVHFSVISLLSKYGLWKNKGLIRPLQGCKDKDKDKDKEIERPFRKFKHLSITIEENKKLIELGYTQEQINQIYDNIENYKKNSNYTSLYLTAINWLKRDFPNVVANSCPYTDVQLREVRATRAAGFKDPQWFDKKYEEFV